MLKKQNGLHTICARKNFSVTIRVFMDTESKHGAVLPRWPGIVGLIALAIAILGWYGAATPPASMDSVKLTADDSATSDPIPATVRKLLGRPAPVAAVEDASFGSQQVADTLEAGYFVDYFLYQLNRLQRGYESDLASSGGIVSLDADNLKGEVDYAGMKSHLEQQRQLITHYQSDFFALFNQGPELLAGLRISESHRETLIKEFNHSLPDFAAHARQYWSSEVQIISLQEDMLVLLEENAGQWRIEGEQVQFSTIDKSSAFKHYDDSLQALLLNRDQILARNLSFVSEKLTAGIAAL